MPSPLRIGFCGPQGAGKSYAAHYIAEHERGLDITILHAISSCYDGIATILGVGRQALEDPAVKDLAWTEADAPVPSLAGVTPRNVMDSIAGYLRMEYGATVLAELWCRTAAMQPADVVINDAVRFPFEVDSLDVVIELTREGVAYDGTKYNTRLPDYCIDFTWCTDSETTGPLLCNRVLEWVARKEEGLPVLPTVEEEA